jgi:VanZ family protein
MKVLLIWLVCVFALSVMPSPRVEVDLPSPDKLLHVIIYAITCVLIYTVLRERSPKTSYSSLVLLSAALSFGYGFLMEAGQTFTETRNFSRWDIMANLAGALAGAFYVRHRIRKNLRQGG